LIDPPNRPRTWPIVAGLGLILVFPFLAVPAQRSMATLAPRIGEINARIVTEGAIWLYAALVLGIALFVERRTLASINLRRPTLGTLGWGLAATVALLVLGGTTSFIVTRVLHQRANTVAEITALVRGSVGYALCLALRAGVVEELLYRGLAIEQLTVLTGNRSLAALIAVLVFVVSHALRFNAASLLPVLVSSAGLVGLYLWRRNLMVNIIAHCIIDGLSFCIVAAKLTKLY
jgi:membrane protease YdiL (CAAX protease family)